MSTDTQTAPQPAHQLTILGRVTSIPLVHDSLGYLDSTLSANSYLRTPYATAQAITSSALHYSEPITTRLAPLITRADGLANQGLDVVESRYPYPFKTPTEQISNDLKERTDYARDVANKTIDARVRSPVYTVVNGVDQRLTPLVDYLASTLARLNAQVGHAEANASAKASSAEDSAKFQYQRALDLTKDIRSQLFVYSHEQLKQLQAQSVLIQRASTTANDITALASSSFDSAQKRVHGLSESMVQQLHQVQSSMASLPGQAQAQFEPVQQHIAGTIHDLSDILKTDAPLNDKVTRVSATVRESVTPVLDAAADAIRAVIQRAEATTQQAAQTAQNGSANGSVH
ncbi:hypothetical protein PENSPDRAFT_461732 [Peniophora sp. CONT]|nr:hypothetical protein PENSPDRAFT_461732 [Peniophora sp. CONT]